jgi:hypothetical protein
MALGVWPGKPDSLCQWWSMMPASPTLAAADGWIHPSYEVRVRETVYLWGSAGLTEDITFARPLLLHVHNDDFGEPITIGTQVASGTRTSLGTLAPSECVSIPVQTISGVYASCALETTVRCLIKD